MSYLRESWLRPLVVSGVMLRNRALVLLTTFNLVNQIATEQIVYTDGWIPMSQNDIYNQIRRESTDYSNYLNNKSTVKYDTLNSVQREINTKNELREPKESFKQVNAQPFDRIETEEIDGKNDKGNSRKAKKVWNSNFNVNHVIVTEADTITSNENKNNIINDIVTDATSNTYEVTEDADIPPLTEENNTTKYVGYQYNPPNDLLQNQNLTSKFYKILSKYGIKTDDELQNYDLSLRNKIHNPSMNGYRVPLPYRYNSLNHLPVDPLLAVFLSNYGFYLPSLYGIKSNYNNLYGYLASNNIHNNKPFGLYKIFSDTDSRN